MVVPGALLGVTRGARPQHVSDLAMSQNPYPDELSYLLHALAAFRAEHPGGELDGGADDGDGLWMCCACGASIHRTLTSVDSLA